MSPTEDELLQWGKSSPLTKLMFSSKSDEWETPDELFDVYNRKYSFVLDAAASIHNHKCAEWFGPRGVAEDALRADWGPYLQKGNIWLNPPYSRGLQAKFVEKAASEIRKPREKFIVEYHPKNPTTPIFYNVVCLLPARTDTKLFHDVIQRWGTVEFLRGRVKFKGAKQGAPFPSMIVVF